jgi:hypothetical protein
MHSAQGVSTLHASQVIVAYLPWLLLNPGNEAMVDVPPEFDEGFLDWFRERTEAAWASYEGRPFEDYVAAHVGGTDWQPGTRWLGGLTEDQIDQIERTWALAFPPDYRLFLRRLHAVDQPMRGATYEHYDKLTGKSSHAPYERPAFCNWLTDTEELRGQFAWLHEGLEFEVEHNDQWPKGWGPKPVTLDAQKQRVRELVAAAPRLIPVFAHRYLVASPNRAGNPVLSVYQSDIVVYGYDLRSYLLFEFYDLLGLDREQVKQEVEATSNARFAAYTSIPFWGGFLSGEFLGF